MNRHAELRARDGADIYLPHYPRLKLPIRFVTGAQNITFTPAGNRKTLEWLSAKNGSAYYDFVEVPGYGHIDCLFGKNVVTEVFPSWLEHFEKTAIE